MAAPSADWFWETDQDLKFRGHIAQRFAGLGVAPSELIALTREDRQGRAKRPGISLITEPASDAMRGTLSAVSNVADAAAAAIAMTVHHSVRGQFLSGTDGAFLGYRGTVDITAGASRGPLRRTSHGTPIVPADRSASAATASPPCSRSHGAIAGAVGSTSGRRDSGAGSGWIFGSRSVGASPTRSSCSHFQPSATPRAEAGRDQRAGRRDGSIAR